MAAGVKGTATRVSASASSVPTNAAPASTVGPLEALGHRRRARLAAEERASTEAAAEESALLLATRLEAMAASVSARRAVKLEAAMQRRPKLRGLFGPAAAPPSAARAAEH